MLNIGVFGAGHLGKIHLKLLEKSNYFNLIGFYDSNRKNAKEIEKKLNYKLFKSPEDLIKKCDVIDIVTPTEFHHEIAIMAIKNKCHLFIEKPISKTTEEAEDIIKYANLNNVLGQVGHVERFNPALIAAKSYIYNPMFIESHRLSEFNPRGTDVPVVLDLMIHDIDIILSVVKSPVKSVNASGVKVISSSPDIANARIEFMNGCVANLTASRISLKNMRKTRFFQKFAFRSWHRCLIRFRCQHASILPPTIKYKLHQNWNLEGIDFLIDFCMDVLSIFLRFGTPTWSYVGPLDSSKTPPRRLPRRSARHFSLQR